VTSLDSEIYFIIASMPEYFEEVNQEFQLFPYQMKITNNNLGVSNFDPNNFIKAYPNPVENILQVELEEYENLVDIDVYSTLGQRVLRGTYFNEKEIQIDFSNVNDGVYFLKVSTNNRSTTLKLVKE